MGRKTPSIVARINLTPEDKAMLAAIGKVLKIGSGTPEYGNTLAAFFRLVIEYAEDNPDSDLAADFKALVERSKAKRRYNRRGPLRVLDGIRDRLARGRLREREDYTVDEAHLEALDVEARRILKVSK